MTGADIERGQDALVARGFGEGAFPGLENAGELLCAVTRRALVRPDQNHAVLVDDGKFGVGVAVIGLDIADQLAGPLPVQMAAEHAEQLAAGILDRKGEVDKSIRLVVFLLRQQRGQQHGLVHVADREPLQAFLEPLARRHRFSFEQAAGRRQHLAVDIGEPDPGQIGEGGLQLLQRAPQVGRIVPPQLLQRLQLRKQLHFELAHRHEAIEPSGGGGGDRGEIAVHQRRGVSVADKGRAARQCSDQHHAHDRDSRGDLRPYREMVFDRMQPVGELFKQVAHLGIQWQTRRMGTF